MKRMLQVLAEAFLALAPLNAAHAQVAAIPAAAPLKESGAAVAPRGHWAYEAVALLSTNDEGGGPVYGREMTRQEFASAVAYILITLPDLQRSLRKYKRFDPVPGSPADTEPTWRLVSRDEANKLFVALRREFAPELERALPQFMASYGVRMVPALMPLIPPPSAPQPQGQQWIEPIQRLQQRLSFLFKEKWQSTTLKPNTRGLDVEFHCDDFAVHATRADGEIARWFTTRRGPNHDGFLLRLSVAQGGYMGPEVLPREESDPYWTTWHDTLPLDVPETDTAKIAAAARASFPGESLDVPRGSWPYKALEALSKSVFGEKLPSDPFRGTKVMVRYDFAVGMARLLERLNMVDAQGRLLATPSEPLPEPLLSAIAKPENKVAMNALMREFGREMQILGVKMDLPAFAYLQHADIRRQHALIHLSYARDTDATLLESIKRAIDDWALAEMRAALALPEAQPQKPQVLAP